MTFGVQFTGSVAAGQTATWFTHSWNAANTVVWDRRSDRSGGRRQRAAGVEGPVHPAGG